VKIDTILVKIDTILVENRPRSWWKSTRLGEAREERWAAPRSGRSARLVAWTRLATAASNGPDHARECWRRCLRDTRLIAKQMRRTLLRAVENAGDFAQQASLLEEVGRRGRGPATGFSFEMHPRGLRRDSVTGKKKRRQVEGDR